MAYKARKQNETASTPPVALFSQTTWVTQQLDQASARQIGQVARKIVHGFSDRELRALPADLRQRLLSHLKNGRITAADRKAVNKLLTAELVEVRYRQTIQSKEPVNSLTQLKHIFRCWRNCQLAANCWTVFAKAESLLRLSTRIELVKRPQATSRLLFLKESCLSGLISGEMKKSFAAQEKGQTQ